MAKSPEQLTDETSVLFDKIEDTSKSVNGLVVQIVQIDSQLKIVIDLMRETLANTPTTAECTLKHDRIVEKLTAVEQNYIDRREMENFKKEFYSFRELIKTEVKDLKNLLMRVGFAFFVPLAGIAVKVIFFPGAGT